MSPNEPSFGVLARNTVTAIREVSNTAPTFICWTPAGQCGVEITRAFEDPWAIHCPWKELGNSHGIMVTSQERVVIKS